MDAEALIRRLQDALPGVGFERAASIDIHPTFYVARDDIRIPPELSGAITPIRAQLLGVGSSVIGHWMPDDEDAPLRGWWQAPGD